ncbi:MAG: hypothetical protein ABEN55_03725 [Bradymonadaceae bacterium]
MNNAYAIKKLIRLEAKNEAPKGSEDYARAYARKVQYIYDDLEDETARELASRANEILDETGLELHFEERPEDYPYE